MQRVHAGLIESASIDFSDYRSLQARMVEPGVVHIYFDEWRAGEQGTFLFRDGSWHLSSLASAGLTSGKNLHQYAAFVAFASCVFGLLDGGLWEEVCDEG